MQNFVNDKKVVEFSKVTGEVLSSDKFSETHVYSRGGGPLPGGGSSAASVHSDVTTKQEFWIKSDDGFEIPIQLSGVDIPIRVGQRITVISAQRVEKKSSVYAALVNHTARKHWVLHASKNFSNKLELITITGFSVLGSAVVYLVSAQILTVTGAPWGQAYGMAWGPAIVYFIYRIFKFFWRVESVGKRFTAHLDTIAKSIY